MRERQKHRGKIKIREEKRDDGRMGEIILH